MPRSWNDLAVMQPMDPRGIISVVSYTDQAGTSHVGAFERSTTWLKATTWVNPPMSVSLPGPSTQSNLVCLNPYDFNSVMFAQNWNAVNQMTVPNNQLPIGVQNSMFFKAGLQYGNICYLDHSVGITSTDIQLSMRDNSTTSGDFLNSALGAVPVFAFPTSTYGGTGRAMSVTLLRTGRFQVALRIIDSSGNWSMFDMDWIVL